MIIYLCIKFQSNTPILSKDITRKPKVLRMGQRERRDGKDVRMDSGDTICAPIENGGGGGGGVEDKKNPESHSWLGWSSLAQSTLFWSCCAGQFTSPHFSWACLVLYSDSLSG